LSWGKQFLSAVLAENSVSALLALGRIEQLFRGSEIDPYKFVAEFIKEYGKLPAEETILAHTGEALTPHKEPSAYYLDLLKVRSSAFYLEGCETLP